MRWRKVWFSPVPGVGFPAVARVRMFATEVWYRSFGCVRRTWVLTDSQLYWRGKVAP